MQRRSFLKVLASSTLVTTANATRLDNLQLDELSIEQIFKLLAKYRENDDMLLVIHDKIVEMKDDEKVYVLLKAFRIYSETADKPNLYYHLAEVSIDSKYGSKKAFYRVVSDNPIADRYNFPSESLTAKEEEWHSAMTAKINEAIKIANKHLA